MMYVMDHQSALLNIISGVRRHSSYLLFRTDSMGKKEKKHLVFSRIIHHFIIFVNASFRNVSFKKKFQAILLEVSIVYVSVFRR